MLKPEASPEKNALDASCPIVTFARSRLGGSIIDNDATTSVRIR